MGRRPVSRAALAARGDQKPWRARVPREPHGRPLRPSCSSRGRTLGRLCSPSGCPRRPQAASTSQPRDGKWLGPQGKRPHPPASPCGALLGRKEGAAESGPPGCPSPPRARSPAPTYTVSTAGWLSRSLGKASPLRPSGPNLGSLWKVLRSRPGRPTPSAGDGTERWNHLLPSRGSRDGKAGAAVAAPHEPQGSPATPQRPAASRSRGRRLKTHIYAQREARAPEPTAQSQAEEEAARLPTQLATAWPHARAVPLPGLPGERPAGATRNHTNDANVHGGVIHDGPRACHVLGARTERGPPTRSRVERQVHSDPAHASYLETRVSSAKMWGLWGETGPKLNDSCPLQPQRLGLSGWQSRNRYPRLSHSECVSCHYYQQVPSNPCWPTRSLEDFWLPSNPKATRRNLHERSPALPLPAGCDSFLLPHGGCPGGGGLPT